MFSHGHRHIEGLFDRLLTANTEQPALSPKTVYEVHLVIRGAPSDHRAGNEDNRGVEGGRWREKGWLSWLTGIL